MDCDMDRTWVYESSENSNDDLTDLLSSINKKYTQTSSCSKNLQLLLSDINNKALQISLAALLIINIYSSSLPSKFHVKMDTTFNDSINKVITDIENVANLSFRSQLQMEYITFNICNLMIVKNEIEMLIESFEESLNQLTEARVADLKSIKRLFASK
jgi:hypothetical protein